MTAGAIRADAAVALLGTAQPRFAAPIDPRLVRDAGRVLIVILLVLLVLAGMVASATYLAGPVPVEGPAPGLNL